METKKEYLSEEFIQEVMNELAKCRARMTGFEIRLDEMTTSIEANAKAVQEIKDSTRELLDILNACKSGLRVLGWVGTVVKFFGGIAAALAAIYGLFQIWHHK